MGGIFCTFGGVKIQKKTDAGVTMRAGSSPHTSHEVRSPSAIGPDMWGWQIILP
jgi:hypothetical protein